MPPPPVINSSTAVSPMMRTIAVSGCSSSPWPISWASTPATSSGLFAWVMICARQHDLLAGHRERIEQAPVDDPHPETVSACPKRPTAARRAGRAPRARPSPCIPCGSPTIELITCSPTEARARSGSSAATQRAGETSATHSPRDDRDHRRRRDASRAAPSASRRRAR